MADFKVATKFIFQGVFTIKGVENADQAREYVEKHCGLVLGGDIHTTLDDETVDWEFDNHPEKRILKVSK